MSDRNMIGILLIFGGIALVLVPHETAVRISGFVQQVSGVGSLAAAFVVVGVSGVMILSGIRILIRRS